MAKVATPLTAVALNAPARCRCRRCALQSHVELSVLAGAVLIFNQDLRLHRKATPATAVLEGWVWTIILPAAAAVTVKMPLLKLKE